MRTPNKTGLVPYLIGTSPSGNVLSHSPLLIAVLIRSCVPNVFVYPPPSHDPSMIVVAPTTPPKIGFGGVLFAILLKNARPGIAPTPAPMNQPLSSENGAHIHIFEVRCLTFEFLQCSELGFIVFWQVCKIKMHNSLIDFKMSCTRLLDLDY